MTSRIVATSRQTRFNPLVQGDASEVDLNDVNIAVGEREILVDGRIRLKGGVRYGLIGRNGCGKSTVLQALADRLIPGIPPSLRIHIVSQVDTEPAPDEQKKEAASAQTALQRVLDGHVERRKALRERAVLEEIIDAEPIRAQGLMDQLMLERKNEELEEARRIALLRSGARGWEARSDEIKAEKELEAAEAKLTKLTVEDDVHLRAAEMLSEVQVTLDLLESDNAESEAIRILRGLGFKEEMMSSPFTSLSGGWRSRCRLATALIVQTDLLILDEPSNFMDLQSILWLEKFLKESMNYNTLVITSHDQVFLDRLSEQTICLREQRLDYFDGTPTAMQTVEAKDRVHKEKVVSAMDKKREHIESSIQNGRKLAKATGDDARMRSVKSREKKLQDRMGLEKSAKGTRFKLNRDLAGYHLTSRADVVVERAEMELAWKIPPPPEIRGGVLISLENVSVGYGKKVILEGLTLTLFPGSRTAIVGSNGQGKSTLAKLITSDLKASKGTVTSHPSLRIGYFSQHIVESLNVASPPLAHFIEHFEALGEMVTEQTARAFLGGLGLQGRTASHVPIGLLSGGQKVRLALALLLFKPPQLLVLDEVTTHLDAYSIRALARALRSWSGAILLITHDRWFSSVVVERKAMDEDPDGEPGDTVMVSKGKMKRIGGMKEYEEIVARRLARRKDI